MRVVLGEDLTLLRDGLIRLLTAYDMEVVAAVDSGPELLRALIDHRPDVAVVDVRLPPTFTDEGLRAAIEARAQLPGLPVLVLSQHVEQLYARELLSAGTGGLGYLLKDRVSDVLRFIEAVRAVAAGGTAMDPEVVSQLLARHERDEQLSRLTPRERDVLALMAEGHSNAGIATKLVVTEKAVNKHISNIFAKLDLYPGEDANRRVLAVLTYLNALAAVHSGDGPLRFALAAGRQRLKAARGREGAARADLASPGDRLPGLLPGQLRINSFERSRALPVKHAPAHLAQNLQLECLQLRTVQTGAAAVVPGGVGEITVPAQHPGDDGGVGEPPDGAVRQHREGGREPVAA